jgi:hypothetical protein
MARRGSGRPRICLFLGPSAPVADVRAIFASVDADLTVLPPARRGDLLRLQTERPEVVGVVDGLFFHVPALLHREIVLAVEHGVRVLGAASIGALRAAELDRDGMEGVGQIYRWYRDGVIDGDDEVALAHAPASEGYRPLAVALVNLRYLLIVAQRRGMIGARTAKAILAASRRIYFAERTNAAILSALEMQRLAAPGQIQALQGLLESGEIDLKRDDALLLARTVARRIAGEEAWPAPPRVQTRLTGLFAGFLETYIGHRVAGRHVAESLVMALHRLLSASGPALVRRVRLRCLALEESTQQGLAAEPDDVLLAHWRQEQGLSSETAFEDSLRRRYLEREDLCMVLRARDLEAQLWTQYRAHDPSLAGPRRFERRLRADLAARFGVSEGGLTGTLLMPPGIPWDAPLVREVKVLGRFGPALRLAERIVSANVALAARPGGEPRVESAALLGWLAARWKVAEAGLRRAAIARGFTRDADLREAARLAYLYEQAG